jgi:hypothetical protein
MSCSDSTGGNISLGHDVAAEIPLVRGSFSGGPKAPGIETPGTRLTGENVRDLKGPVSLDRSTSRRSVSERTLRRRRIQLKACLEELERARTNAEDVILRSNAMDDARRYLEVLWEQVKDNPDSAPFEEMINILQIALCPEELEVLTVSQMDALRSVLTKMHEDPDLNDQTANDLTQELMEGGIDVFRGIE